MNVRERHEGEVHSCAFSLTRVRSERAQLHEALAQAFTRSRDQANSGLAHKSGEDDVCAFTPPDAPPTYRYPTCS